MSRPPKPRSAEPNRPPACPLPPTTTPPPSPTPLTALRAAAAQVLTKPVTSRQLLHCLKEALSDDHTNLYGLNERSPQPQPLQAMRLGGTPLEQYCRHAALDNGATARVLIAHGADWEDDYAKWLAEQRPEPQLECYRGDGGHDLVLWIFQQALFAWRQGGNERVRIAFGGQSAKPVTSRDPHGPSLQKKGSTCGCLFAMCMPRKVKMHN